MYGKEKPQAPSNADTIIKRDQSIQLQILQIPRNCTVSLSLPMENVCSPQDLWMSSNGGIGELMLAYLIIQDLLLHSASEHVMYLIIIAAPY